MSADNFTFIDTHDEFQPATDNGVDLSDNASLDSILKQTGLRKAARVYADLTTDASDSFANQYPDSTHANRKAQEKATQLILRLINQIDCQLEQQVNEILHHERFQKLESSWRSLHSLTGEADQYDRDNQVKVKLLNCCWASLSKDMGRAIDFDQSAFFKHVYQNEFDNPGGEPFGVLIGDYEISHLPRSGLSHHDLDTLSEVTRTCAAAFVPFITAASPELFGVSHYAELGYHMNLSRQFEQSNYVKWNRLREMEESRFLGLTVPRVLLREPYIDDDTRKEAFKFREQTTNSSKHMLWGNAAYPFAVTLIRAFCESGWFGHIRGLQPGQMKKGIVSNLAQAPFETDIYQKCPKAPVDLLVTERQEKELSNLGFIPVSPVPNSGFVAFYSNASAQKPQRYDSLSATVNAKISAMLQYVLCVSRFAHYIKILSRERIGSYATAQSCERDLQSWINQYTTASDSASEEVRSRYPLSDAKVTVREHASRPGHYYSVLQLQPHFQLDQMISSIRMVTELTPKHMN
ncbi:type VI secretion system contractile sheath large subunit [Algicola sagamiensis]|uniref:type VI secretion system contractile sheath large subunit n=1 Tax=Algicola sagamiensis TaxID=163869 RepID=UPI000368D472|nr:type VI secretion system contractile sheath large subunit [Algicola sagamiensis]